MAKILPYIVATSVVLQFVYLTQPTEIQSFLDFLQLIFNSCMVFAVTYIRTLFGLYDTEGRGMKFKSFIQFVIILILLYFIGGYADRMPYAFNGKVSRYPDSKIVSLMRLNGGCYAELETNDSWKNVLEYYKYHMSKSGWSIATPNRDDSESAAFLVFFKDNEGLMIDTYPSVTGDKTQIALFMGDIDE